MPPIVFMLGSDSDLPTLEGGFALLRELDVQYGVRILSAHRTPTETAEFAAKAESEGVRVLIAAAGMAAALPGVVAAHTLLPVIGIPVGGGALNGVDALYSIVQMPGGVPVATMGIGSHGAKNAALLAVRILALQDADLKGRLTAWIEGQADKVRKKDEEFRRQHG